MQSLAPLAAFLVVGAGVACGQSLAEVAKNEKDRRARTPTSGTTAAVPVIGHQELERSRGDSLSVMGQNAEDADAESKSSADESESPERRLTERGVFDYDRMTTWCVGLIVKRSFGEPPPLARDLLRKISVCPQHCITLHQLFDHPFFAL